jgi:lactate dehydrogenase-like 2-hydroxyacid dehydrogenase
MRKIFAHCFLSESQKRYLEKNFALNIHNSNEKILSSDELIAIASGYHGIICQGNVVSNKYIKKNCNTLKVISNVSVGYDNVDIEFASRNNVAVLNTPNILDDAVADLSIGLLIASARKICEGNNYVKAGKWKKNSWPLFLGEDLSEETLGIIGMGNIGKKVAIRASAFNLKILYHNRNRLNNEDETTYNASYSDLDSLLNLSKYVLLLCPLTAQTKYLMNKETFALMRKDAFIINMARGKIIKEYDLVQALENRVIAGAGLDVFEFEPKVSEKLMTMKNTVLMPHAGSATYTTRRSMVEMACKNITNFLLNDVKDNLVNKIF